MSEERHSRRAFFREVVKRYVEPAVDYLDARDAAGQPVILRPPGAIAEAEFLDCCERCHACVSACPADAIRSIEIDGPLKGTPGIVAAEQACVVCTDLDCMQACPSGALLVVLREQIEMGLAVVDHETCVRSKGESCRSCVDLCPVGTRAIEIGADDRVNVLEGCIGCGVCEQVCPTTPRSVVIEPNERRGEQPVEERQGVRGLLLTPDQRVLLMKIKEPGTGVEFWIAPGGGIEEGESETLALLRELSEEIGRADYTVGPPVWKRTSRFTWEGRHYRQRDTTYLIRTPHFDPGEGGEMEEIERRSFRGFRWWSVEEIEASHDVFSPRRLAEHLRRLVAEGPPAEPVDTGR